jgi:ABC-2 type transport system permease protein
VGSFPIIGYQRDGDQSEDTRKQGLPKREDLPPPDRPGVRSRSLFGPDSDWIPSDDRQHCTDQIAIAPGYLTREWVENGRRYFSYDMGDTKIVIFIRSSARYGEA